MTVRLLTGPKAGKIADVTPDYGRELISKGEAEPVGESGETWPQAPEQPEQQPAVVVQPVIIEAEKKRKPRKRLRG